MENPENAQEPNELEAWKVMMDSMIKFIHASTKLMNTFNQKASNVILPQFCGMECMPCEPQKQKTSICAAAAYQQKAGENGNLDESDVDTPNPVNNTADNTKDMSAINESTRDNTQEQVTPADNAMDGTQRTKDTLNETPKTNATVDDTQKTNDTLNETPKTNDIFNETPKTNNTSRETPRTSDTSVENQNPNATFNETQKTNDTFEETLDETRNTNDTFNETQKTNNTFEETLDETRNTNDTFDDTQKTNETGDDSGFQSQKNCKGKCSCSGKKKSKQELCACPLTSQETANLTESMAAKLTKAQSEIDGLKDELEKLQFMEYTKKSNTAALYKQIMKDTNMPRNMTSTKSTSNPAQFTSMASVPSTCSPCCGRMFAIGSPEPDCRSSSTSPMAQPQFARGIPQGRGSPEPEFRSLYSTTAQSNFPGQQSTAASPMAPSQFSRSSPGGRGSPEPEFRSLYSKKMTQSRFPGETSIPASRQGYTPTNKSAMQSLNESNFLRKPAGWKVNTPTNTTTMQGYDDSLYPSPAGPRQGQTPTNLSTMQSYNDSNFIRSPAPTAKNVARQDNSFGPSSPSFNDPAMTGVGLSRGNQSLLYRFPRASHSINESLILPAFGPTGPSFDNLLTSSMIGFPQANQPQLQVPRGHPQMRPTEVECSKYKKPKRKPTSPIPNQSHFDPRCYSQMNGGGGVNRTVENQVPFRSIQVMQAAVTVCTPPRTYADSGMYDDLAVYDDQEYQDPTCDNFSCDNDTCEN